MLKQLLSLGLAACCMSLQYKLWFAPGGWLTVKNLQYQIATVQEQNQDIEHVNARLIEEISSLKQGHEMVEHQARMELGLVRGDETYYRYI